ncbi:MAG TPA: GSCFA domain-containing protein [Bacteroidales bacterium]|nr:GSCFA domain-containing protein [Bacteroidales bacterium]
MRFRTEISPTASERPITHKDKLLFLGSCFSDNMGEKMLQHKFDSLSNPFGVLYNPASILQHLERLLSGDDLQPDLNMSGELHFDYRFHGSFSHPSSEKAKQNMMAADKRASNQLKEAGFIFITWGTAWVYRLKKSGQIVANCHKQGASKFHREKLSPEEITTAWQRFLSDLFDNFPDKQVVITVSPVRHLKDGFAENQRSKAALLLAAEHLENSFEQVSYFPSYEIMLDDLRDYRFYADDLTHPSSEAVEYLWAKFSGVYFNESTQHLNKQLAALHAALNHRLQFPCSSSAQRFAQSQLHKITELEKQLPGLNFADEKLHFQQFITT